MNQRHYIFQYCLLVYWNALLLLFLNMREESYSRSSTKDPIVPVEQRECTDCQCLVIFISFILVIFIIGAYAWSAGNFKRLTTAFDPDGKGCGLDYPNYPYIYFASPHSESLWVTVCVSQCPTANSTVLACQTNSVVITCNPVNSTNSTKAVQIYNSTLVANTVCMPVSSTIKDQISSALGGSSGSLTSLLNNYSLILLGIPIAIIVAVIVMLIIRCTASFFIYMLILLAVGALSAAGVYLLLAPANISTATIVASSICFFFALLIILTVFCVRKRLALATSIIKVAAKFVSQNCLVVLLPVLLFVITVAYLTLWVLQALGFYSLGQPTTALHQYPFQHFTTPTDVKILFGFHIFQLIWVLLFLIQTSSFIIGGTATSWYYKHETPYAQASQRYRKKHMGSVAFGSFMLALLGLLRVIYQMLVPQGQGDGGPSLLKRCCDCFCCVCTKLFDWFTTGAFTVVNIRGATYCTSGAEAFRLRVANIGTSSVVGMVQSIFTLLVRLGITFLTILIVDLLIENVNSYRSSMQDSSLLLVVVAFVSFTISCFFISVYSDAIDAIYMTYLVDKERGDAKAQCPPDLKEFLEEADKGN